jgi:uncharacterized protein YbjT (DUF2867 family)
MRIAVMGGTGTIGRRIVSRLEARGHEVRALSRHAPEYPVDLTTGSGLTTALEGCQVVIDASNGPPGRRARAVLVDGSRRLLDAEPKAGVQHHICVSIVGIEDVPMSYYRVKIAQEQVVKSGGVPWTIVRATQFHDLVATMLKATARFHVLPAPQAKLQPVDAGDAADAVATVATQDPHNGIVTVAGPEVLTLRTLSRIWREAAGRRGPQLPIPLPGPAGRALRQGRLTCADPDTRGTRTFADWARSSERMSERDS